MCIRDRTEVDSYRQAMEKAGFRPSGMDFYGKQEHELKVETGDGGIFELRIFQTEEGKVGLRVQYEKDHIINGARTVHAVSYTHLLHLYFWP